MGRRVQTGQVLIQLGWRDFEPELLYSQIAPSFSYAYWHINAIKEFQDF